MNLEDVDVNSPDDVIARYVLHEFGHALGFIHEHQSPAMQELNWNKPAVYAHYKKTDNWEPSEVDSNVLARYDQMDITNSTYDPNSIMLYQLPAHFFTNGVATKHTIKLSAGDIAMAQKMYPKQYSRTTGQARFLAGTARGLMKPARVILPSGYSSLSQERTFDQPYDDPPHIAMGINNLGMDSSTNGYFYVGDGAVTENGLSFSTTQYGGSNAYNAGATWLEIDPDAINIQTGRVDLGWDPQKNTETLEALVRFPRKFTDYPKVLLWFRGFDYPESTNTNSSTADSSSIGFLPSVWDTNNSNFTILMNHFGIPYKKVRLTWIAVDSDIEGVACGTIKAPHTGCPQGTPSNPFKQQCRYGKTRFPEGTFDSPPRVFIAPRGFMWEPKKALQFACGANDVTEEDFEWCFETWADASFVNFELDWIAVP